MGRRLHVSPRTAARLGGIGRRPRRRVLPQVPDRLMQTSIILVQGERIDMERLQLALDGFETTSTSSMLVASMDATRRAMALHGEQLLGRALALSRRAGQEIGGVPGVRPLRPPPAGRPRGARP